MDTRLYGKPLSFHMLHNFTEHGCELSAISHTPMSIVEVNRPCSDPSHTLRRRQLGEDRGPRPHLGMQICRQKVRSNNATMEWTCQADVHEQATRAHMRRIAMTSFTNKARILAN